MSYKPGDVITYQIGEHTFVTPPIPPKKEILFHDLPRAQQYWRRQTDFPAIFYDWHREDTKYGKGVELDAPFTEYSPDGTVLISLSKEDTLKLFGDKEKDGIEGLQNREVRRRREGIFFYNNGEITYMPGDYYGVLQWFPMLGADNEAEPGSEYGQYMEFQRDAVLFLLICERTDMGYGGMMVKSKKTGVTQLMAGVCLNRATMIRQKNIRMMSITEDICKDTCFNFIAHSMKGVPPIILPARAKQNLGEVIFGAPNSARNPLKVLREDDGAHLNTLLSTVPTTRAGFDSKTNFIAWIDEFPKIRESTWPKELFTATIAAVKEGVKRKGTVFATSYTPEESDRSFREARELFKASKLNTRPIDPETGEQFGKTASELLCYTLTADKGIFGCCDIYGKPMKSKILAFIKENENKLKDNPIALQAFKRQYPFNESDPWQEGNTESTLFDNYRLGQQRISLEEDRVKGVLPYIDFNLEFEIPPTKKPLGTEYNFPGKILMIPVSDEQKRKGAEHGRFKWYDPQWTPEDFMQRYVNRRIVNPKTGLLMPDPESPFFLSMDPTNFRSKKYTEHGSMNSFMGFIMPNVELDSRMNARVTEKRLFWEYYYRCESPAETLDDMIKMVLYLNCYVQMESNMTTWAEDFIAMGLGHFLLMINKETGALEPWNPKRQQSLFSSQQATIPWYTAATKEHLAQPRLRHQIDNISLIKSETVISQLMMFRMEDTKQFDAAVAYMEGIMGINALMGWKQRESDKKNRKGNGDLATAAYGLVR